MTYIKLKNKVKIMEINKKEDKKNEWKCEKEEM